MWWENEKKIDGQFTLALSIILPSKYLSRTKQLIKKKKKEKYFKQRGLFCRYVTALKVLVNGKTELLKMPEKREILD